MKHLLLILTCSILFPISFSRMAVTIDAPSDFSLSLSSWNSNEPITYSTKIGFSIAYEHLITQGKVVDGSDIYVFAGGEFMTGRRSDINISLHSAYIKPMLGITENFLLVSSLGLASLKTDQNDFILDMGTVISMGIEYGVTDNLSLALSKSYYNLFEKEYSDFNDTPLPPSLEQAIGGSADLDGTTVNMHYEKIGLSIIYGFKTKK